MFIPHHPGSIHERMISRTLACPHASELGPDATADVDVSLFVCFTNRSGSNFLADLLRATGEFPIGLECFHQQFVIGAAKKHQLRSFADYCRHHAESSAMKRRFVGKVSSGQLVMLARLGYLGRVFPNPRFIHIQRYDVIAQAISFVLAQSTKAWSSLQTSRMGESEVAYDAKEIADRIKTFASFNAAIRDFLLINRLEPLPVLYEQLAADPEPVIKHIFAWLGLDAPAIGHDKLRHERQNSDVKDEWYARYIAEPIARPVPARRWKLFGRR